MSAQQTLHLMAFLSFSYSILLNLIFSGVGIDKEDVESHPQLGLDQFGGPWKYLTFWNVWVQAIYFLMCYVNDKRGREKHTKLKKAEDYLYATLAFPVGMFVGIVFWTLFAIDRELVFPAMLDKYVPAHLNHIMHTSVIPLQLFELLFVRHQYPKSLAKGALVTVALCFTYCVWIQVVATLGNFWIYPIFNVLSPFWRYAFLCACSAFGAVLYFLGYAVNRARWAAAHLEAEIEVNNNYYVGDGKKYY